MSVEHELATPGTTLSVGSYDKMTFFHRGAAGLVPAGATPPPLMSTTTLRTMGWKIEGHWCEACGRSSCRRSVVDCRWSNSG
jgi:hypothetical protein